MIERFTAPVAAFVERRAWFIVLVALGIFVAAVLLARGLPIDQEFRRLLPESSPEVQRLEELDRRLGNQNDLVIAISSPSREANLAFGAALAAKLETREDLRWVLFRRDPKFFEDHALLYMDLGELLELRDDVVERIRDSVEENVIEQLDDDEDTEAADSDADNPLDGNKIKDRFDGDDDLREYMETDEGRLVVIKARPATSSSNLGYAEELGEAVRAAAESLNPASFHLELEVTVEGSYGEHVKRAASMRNAVVDGSLAALAILLLSIAIFFRSARAVMWILVPLLLSVTAALGFARVVYGHLNLVSAFIFAVLLGLGIDFGVHLLSRYRDERGRGKTRGEAIARTMATTGLSTAAGAMSTAGAFMVLGLSRFQGFAQFGVVAGVGVLFSLVGALLLLPAMIVLMGGKGPHTFGYRGDVSAERSVTTRMPKISLLVLLVGIGLGGYGAMAAPTIQFEYDMGKLGPKRAKKKTPDAKKADEAPKTNEEQKWRDAAGRGRDTAPAVVLTESLEQAEIVHRQLAVLLPVHEEDAPAGAADPAPKKTEENDEEDDDDPFGDDEEDEDPFESVDPPEIARLRILAAGPRLAAPAVQALLDSYDPSRLADMKDRLQKIFSIYDFVPDRQTEKLVVIADIKRRIDAKRGALTPEDREKVDEWYHKLEVTKTFGVDDLPDWVKGQLTDADGRLGTFVMFWAYGPKANYNNAKKIRDAFFDIKLEEGTAPSAADYYVLPAIIEAIMDDGPRVMIGALLVMIIAAWLLIGGVWGPLVVTGTVGIALLWLAAIMSVMGWKADMFNLIAFPLLFGIGQDDALHLYHRYREEGRGSLRQAIRQTGSAIFLTTFTTAIGFSGIFFSNHRGLLSLARIAVIGVILCWISSVVILPAAIRVSEWLQSRREAAA